MVFLPQAELAERARPSGPTMGVGPFCVGARLYRAPTPQPLACGHNNGERVHIEIANYPDQP